MNIVDDFKKQNKVNPDTGLGRADEMMIREYIKNGSDLRDVADDYGVDPCIIKMVIDPKLKKVSFERDKEVRYSLFTDCHSKSNLVMIGSTKCAECEHHGGIKMDKKKGLNNDSYVLCNA